MIETHITSAVYLLVLLLASTSDQSVIAQLVPGGLRKQERRKTRCDMEEVSSK